jgi:hypothetical protein
VKGEGCEGQPTPTLSLPLMGPAGTLRAVNEQRQTKVSLRNLLSFQTTPIPTFPLKGKESYPQRG